MRTGTNEAPGRRTYHAPRREAAARATRARVITAASQLFLADGYAPTSVRSVAKAAGVAEKTVYLQFDTKPELLKAVVETAIVGDDEAVPAAGREWFLDVLAQTDLEEKLKRLVAATSALHERTGAIFTMARGAAAVDAEAATLWSYGKQGHRADMTLFAENFEQLGLLPVGVDLDWAVQTLYIQLGPEAWQLARMELGLDEQRYRTWLYTSLYQAFSG